MSRLTSCLLCLLTLCSSACSDGDYLLVTSNSPATGARDVSPVTTVVATFDDLLSANGLTADTFYLAYGEDNTRVPATLTGHGTNTATLTPNQPLEHGFSYLATLDDVISTKAFELKKPYQWSFEIAAALAVVATTPANGALGVSIGASVSASFSEVMDLDALRDGAFTLAQGETEIAGMLSLDVNGTVATFTPAVPLGAGLVYTATVSTHAIDEAHVGLAAPYVWSFTTELFGVPPTVSATAPADAGTNVALGGPISATFSEEMASDTLDTDTFLVTAGGLAVAGAVLYDGASKIATFTPSLPFQADAEHTATITSGVTDEGGTALAANFTWTFRTVDARPSVVAFTPSSAAPYISINDKLRATFSAAMDPATVTATTFTLAQGQTPVGGSVAYDTLTHIATFSPNAALVADRPYTATISNAATDTSARALATSFSWSFTTTACGQLPVNLRTARPFALLAGGGVTDTGSSTVIGNVGASPSASINGFLGGAIIGTTEADSQVARAAKVDLGLAYTDAETRDQLCAVAVGPALTGTRTPGLYRAANSLTVSGTLTLDAQGDADAVFIFQVPGGLSVLTSSQVELINGARAANVFWQLDASATIGSVAVFVGTILTRVSVTLDVGASLEGRALADNGFINLDGSDVFLPEL
ncbi:MAG: Ig-like domain-containing protein [Polyangiaceae bacterium]